MQCLHFTIGVQVIADVLAIQLELNGIQRKELAHIHRHEHRHLRVCRK